MVFIPSYAFSPHEVEGWLLDLAAGTIRSLQPPAVAVGEHADFLNATITPDGQAIIYRPTYADPFVIWKFDNNVQQELADVLGHYTWLDPGRYLLTRTKDGVFWYDVGANVHILVLGQEQLPGIDAWSLSPQADRFLFTQFSVETGPLLDGLWLFTLDAE